MKSGMMMSIMKTMIPTTTTRRKYGKKNPDAQMRSYARTL